MEKDEVFRTHEGLFRILVEQVIDGKAVDWFHVRRSEIFAPDKIAAHRFAVMQWLTGMPVAWTGNTTETGYEFTVIQ